MSARVRLALRAALAAALLAPSRPAAAQPPDTLRLGALQRAAESRDPRARQLGLQEARTALRLRSLRAERLPALSASGQAQHQSDVTRLDVALPGGVRVPTPAHDTYDARLGAQQRLLDPTLAPRRALETAQLGQTDAQLRAALYQLRQQVSDAFFQALTLRARAAELEAAATDLEARLAEARKRVRAGAALPGDTAALQAELLRRRVDRDGLLADERAALTVLGDLTGVPADGSALPELPDLAAAVAEARARVTRGDTVRGRPEYAGFARARAVLDARTALVRAGARPQLGAFARAGYGRPGLNMLSDRIDAYWLAGLQVQWAPFTWGTDARDREALAIEQQVVRTDEQSFTAQLRRALARDDARLAYLDTALAADDRIVALREQVERETRVRLGEGVVTAAEYVNRRTDVLDARLARAAHRVERAQAQARYLTTLGIDVP